MQKKVRIPKKQAINLIKAFAFCIVLVISILYIQSFFGVDSDISYGNERGFLKEKNGSLDAVFIGGSDVYRLWEPLFGWKLYGVAAWNYAIPAISPIAIRYLLKEAIKTQPNALYIISLNVYKGSSIKTKYGYAHYIVDYLPLSSNRLELTEALVEGNEFSAEQAAELFFPIMKFHTRWDKLKDWVFDAAQMDYKSSYHTKEQTSISDVSKGFNISLSKGTIPNDIQKVFDELLEYCSKNEIKVLFVKMPQAISEEEQGRMNSLEDQIIEKGFECLDLYKHFDELCLDLKNDYVDKYHLNIHGEIKLSRYLGEYLIDKYGIENKRGMKEWESWDKSATEYRDYLSSYILPFEEYEKRNNISAPKLNKLSISGQTITVSWEASDGAKSYGVFRSEADSQWEMITETDQLEYIDQELDPKTKYIYTIVPMTIYNGQKSFGHFNAKGVSGTTGGTK